MIFVFCGFQLFMHILLTASSMNSCSFYALEVTAESMREHFRKLGFLSGKLRVMAIFRLAYLRAIIYNVFDSYT